jgi:hypothetical protein
MPLTTNQRTTVKQVLEGDHTVDPPVLGWYNYENVINNAREDIRAVLRLDLAGSLSGTLIDDIQAARFRAKAAAQALVDLL